MNTPRFTLAHVHGDLESQSQHCLLLGSYGHSLSNDPNINLHDEHETHRKRQNGHGERYLEKLCDGFQVLLVLRLAHLRLFI